MILSEPYPFSERRFRLALYGAGALAAVPGPARLTASFLAGVRVTSDLILQRRGADPRLRPSAAAARLRVEPRQRRTSAALAALAKSWADSVRTSAEPNRTI